MATTSNDFSFLQQQQNQQQPNSFRQLSSSTDTYPSSRSHTPPILNSIDARTPNFNPYPCQLSKVLISAVGFSTNSNVTIIPPIIDKDLLTSIIGSFLQHNYRVCPVIYKKEFLDRFQKLVKSDDTVDLGAADDPFELFMVLAVGSTGLERTGIINRDKKISEYFVSMALNHVHNNLSSNDLVNVRNLTLLAVYSFFNPAEFTSWEIMGKLTRLAIHLGMNHKISNQDAKTLTETQIEMRYRLFWSVYNLDRLSSVSLGRPVAIHDDDINVPFPHVLEPGEEEDIAVNRMIINLRNLEGKVLRKVHSVNIHKNLLNRDKSKEELCEVILAELRLEIEDWYELAKSLDRANTPSKHSVSFHVSIPWYAARYHHLLILLYRPSYLNPNPPQNLLDILGKSCLETLSYTFKLFKSKLLALNWTTLYRFLMVCNTILYCLCKWAIDLMESKTEICYCIEIFEAFGNDWLVAKKCSEVFKKIENKLLEITLTDGHVSDMDNLSKELLGASSSYHEILNVHSADLCIDSEFMYSF
ncbi:STB5 Protein STB5 [Candida maltosa Xu316]